MSVKTSTARRLGVGCAAALAALAFGARPAAQTATAPPQTAQTSVPASPQVSTPAPPAGPVLNLTMQQAVDMGLQYNLTVKLAKLNPAITAEDVASARAAFSPLVTSQLSRSTADQLPSSFTDITTGTISSTSIASSTTFSQQLAFHGLAYSVNWSGSRSTTAGTLSTFNPRLGSSLTFGVRQPLWRNFSIDSPRQTLKIEERAATITDIQVEQQVVSTERDIRLSYLGLVSAIASRDVAQQILGVAQERYREDKARVDVGAQAPVDLVADEAEVANGDEGVIVAEATIQSAEDGLRALIIDPSRADYWQLHLVPADRMDQVQPRTINVDDAIANALKNRTDLVAARKQLDINQLQIDLLHEEVKPQLDLTVQYSAQGVSGTQYAFGSGFPPPVISQTNRGYGSALSDTFSNAYPSWTYGVQFSYPLGLNASRAQAAKATLQQNQQQVSVKNQELNVVSEVRAAARNVDLALKQVDATQKVLEATQTKLDATQKKFNVSLASSFDIIQAQRDLASALVSALQAKISYNRALIAFDAIQKVQ